MISVPLLLLMMNFQTLFHHRAGPIEIAEWVAEGSLYDVKPFSDIEIYCF